MKLVQALLLIAVLVSSVFAHASSATFSTQDKLRAANATNVQLLKELRAIKVARHGHCDDDDKKDDNYRCVPNCTVRSADGSCLYYTSDFCGPDASCSMNCTVRAADGDCLYYSSDICR